MGKKETGSNKKAWPIDKEGSKDDRDPRHFQGNNRKAAFYALQEAPFFEIMQTILLRQNYSTMLLIRVMKQLQINEKVCIQKGFSQF